MRCFSISIKIIFVLITSISTLFSSQAQPDERLSDLFKKDSVTILITDSGLGGLSVFAEVDKKMREYKPFKDVTLVFANALVSAELTYNSLESSEEKVALFDKALNGMAKLYNPDIILIACNTLSVVYHQTKFSKTVQIPVIDIVEFGVNALLAQLNKYPLSSAILFGTPTTMQENNHKTRLIENGINKERMITQPCEMLETEIQIDPESELVESMIEMYTMEALDNLPDISSQVNIGLFCTHYGYVANLFEEKYKEQTLNQDITIVNPNSDMSDIFFPEIVRNRFAQTTILLEVTSQVELSQKEIDGIGKKLRETSPQAAEALGNYILNTKMIQFP